MYPVEQVEQLTLFPQGTHDHANLSVMPGSEKAKKMTAISGQKLSAYLKPLDPVGLLVKMLLDTSHWGSMMCFLTWGVSVTPRNRLLYQLYPSEHHTADKGYLLLPTMSATDYKGCSSKRYKGSKEYHGTRPMEALRNGLKDPCYLNPSYGELLMGFPMGWTELEPSETQLFQDKSIPS